MLAVQRRAFIYIYVIYDKNTAALSLTSSGYVLIAQLIFASSGIYDVLCFGKLSLNNNNLNFEVHVSCQISNITYQSLLSVLHV